MALLSIQEVYKRMEKQKRKKTRDTRKKTPTKTQPQHKTQNTLAKAQKPSATLHHSKSSLAFTPSRTLNRNLKDAGSMSFD
jgi:hypothetical protein